MGEGDHFADSIFERRERESAKFRDWMKEGEKKKKGTKIYRSIGGSFFSRCGISVTDYR